VLLSERNPEPGRTNRLQTLPVAGYLNWLRSEAEPGRTLTRVAGLLHGRHYHRPRASPPNRQMNHRQMKHGLTRFICSGAGCSGESGTLPAPAGSLSAT
jgi:hypothetical protein